MGQKTLPLETFQPLKRLLWVNKTPELLKSPFYPCSDLTPPLHLSITSSERLQPAPPINPKPKYAWVFYCLWKIVGQ